MFNVKKNTIQGYKNFEFTYTVLNKGEGSRKLAILLPGAGYTVQAPMLHYATGVLINRGFDVLHVNYQYNDSFYDDFGTEELNKAINYDVNLVLDYILQDKSYDDYCLIGKSIGTMAMRSVLDRDGFKSAKAVWMTPLIHRDDVLNAMVSSQNNGLCFIGDNDWCYSSERFAKIEENPNITSKLIPNVNHSLEYNEDALSSIDVLKDVIRAIEDFC